MHMNRLVRFWPCDLTYNFLTLVCILITYFHNTAMRILRPCTVHPRIFCQWFPLVVLPYDKVHLCLALEDAIP